ncbi:MULTISPECIES: nucleotidyltransferase domain-containing protein [Cyanophyceae]|uniref:Nucleotidyltransferase domain-containing protein n=1 Tax=Leptolyngbya subtilissima DQ-A4 TaxID=2933933 RepID=A0ABV0K5Y8_9CYAN|nr:nucleotidyltransferase domain-containing protein [Nodosilinea sp. FACHB-141]MBD2114412.1 nucleotidyltransferase domain-containing protein [Nodosilinea sp. FACHB-141]
MALASSVPQIYERLGILPLQLAEFSQRWGIAELALFGSVLRDDFRDDSDVDVLITFAPNARKGLLTLAKMQHELQAILNRKVDLVSKKSIEQSHNAIRRQVILASAQVIYSA